MQWILSTHSRSSLKMRGFEPSIDLDVENCFFEKGCQLNNYFFGTFLPSWMRPRDTVNMQSIELVAIFVAPCDFQNFFGGPLRAPQDPPGRGKSSVHAPSVDRSSSKQIDCIFAMDYGALGPPTLQICSQSARRTGPRKYAVNRARGPLRGTLGRPRSCETVFLKSLST